MPTRYITRVKKLYDVSPVTYPAYPDTTVAVRSLEQFRKQFYSQKYFNLFDKKLQLLSKLI